MLRKARLPPTDFPAERQRYGEMRFCPRCAKAFEPQDFRAVECLFICASCGFDFYQNPVPAAVVVLVDPDDDAAILLLKRRTAPNIGRWCVPGGFIGYGERPEDAAKREVLEEVGVEATIDRVLHAGLVDYLYRGRHICIVEVSYLARIAAHGPAPGAQSAEATEIAFKPLAQILADPGMLAFPEQADVLRVYQRLVAERKSPNVEQS